MAAYGALVSVMHIIDQIQTHPNPPISIHPKQVESLTQAVTSLQHFLESYSPHVGYTEEEDIWESRIAEAAYAAEDVIESYIVDQIHARARNDVENISSTEFYQGLQKVIDNMNLIKIEIDEKVVVHDQLHIMKSVIASSSRSASAAKNVTMVGFDDVLLQMLDKISGGGPARQILPIVGMGGIGKTTLARNIFVSPVVQEYFDVCAWSTISQGYDAHEILRQILDQVDKGKGGDLSVYELGDHLYKYLFGRKYFIVMDDMWDIEAWDGVRRFFPDNKNGSRIVVTTRLSNLASQFNYSNGLDLKFLDEDASWNLFSKTVFGEEACPLELKDVGKKIVEGCKGLPLSVAVIGGFLSKSKRTKESWRLVEKYISSIVNLDNDKSCLQVLFMSYNNLPIHLKPCFLYMGKYDEDEVISITEFIISSIGKGFVKPINGKSVEEAVEEYVEELIDRNMLIAETRYCGKLLFFKMHDLLRYICMREAKKLKFLCVLEERSIPEDIISQRRIIGRSGLIDYSTPLLQSLGSMPFLRTLFEEYQKILRVVVIRKYSEEEYSHDYYEEILHGLVNLRVLAIDVKELPLPFSVYFFWNLQTLILGNVCMDFVCEIWKMPQLRFVLTCEGTLDGAYCLPDSFTEKEDMVLKNLGTLYTVSNLKFGEGVLKRIPNIKQLGLCYERKVNTLGEDSSKEEDNYYHLNNVCFLHKLEHLQLRCSSQHTHIIRQVSFPHSLKILTLEKTYLPWEDMKTKIGVLPLLQVLMLKLDSFVGSEWETVEDQFSNLKFLLIERCDVKCWITDSTHFPRLEHLHLCFVRRLREIPTCIADIPTLHSIEVVNCSDSVGDSVMIITEEKRELGHDFRTIIRRNF